MNHIRFSFITALFVISLSCKKSSNTVEPSDRLSKISDSITNIIYNNEGNPTLVEFGINSVSVDYNSNKISKLTIKKVDNNLKSEIEIRNISYIGDRTVYIEPDKTTNSYFDSKTLYFNTKGLIDSSKTNTSNIFGKATYNNKFYYDSNDNLIKLETIQNNKIGNFITYEMYDGKNNPFFEKAQLWSLILGDEGIYIGPYMAFPISKSNPTIITLRNYDAGNKLKYSYNSKNFPIKIEEYFYKGLFKKPMDSDYTLEDKIITISY